MEKMVSFRLSVEELELVKDHCNATNARSVSEVAREAVQFYLGTQQPKLTRELQSKVMTLESKIALLQLEIADVSQTIRSLCLRNNDRP